MTKQMLAASAALIAMVSASPAFAAKTFHLTATSTNFTIDATLTTTDDNNQNGYKKNTGYLVTGISGMIGGNTITGLVAVGNYPDGNGNGDKEPDVGNDNILKDSSPFFDYAGLSFTTSDGPSPFNLYYDSGYFYVRGPKEGNSGTLTSVTVTPVVSSVPEPAAWMMMIVGVGAVGFAMRRQKVATRLTYTA